MTIDELTRRLRAKEPITWTSEVVLDEGSERTEADGTVELSGTVYALADGERVYRQQFAIAYPDSMQPDDVDVTYGDHVDQIPERSSGGWDLDCSADEISELEAEFGIDPLAEAGALDAIYASARAALATE